MIKDKKKDFLFNTIGSIIYALNSVILLMLVVQIVGAEKGGIFSIAFTISQTLAVVGNFEMRVFQVTDNKYKFQDFFLSRIITSLVMILGAVGWIVFNSYSKEKIFIIIILCCYRLSDSFGDVIEGYYQHENKLYLSGIFVSLRSGIPTIIFVISLILSRNLAISCLLLFVSAMVALLVIDFYTLTIKDRVAFSGGSINASADIIKNCFPLFVGAFLSTYTANAPKYAIDKFLNEEMQTYYSIIFMPSFAINLVSGFIFKPFLLDISNMWEKREVRRINGIIFKMGMLISTITLMGIVCGAIIGIPVLQLIYGVDDLQIYKVHFLFILFGGGISAVNAFLYHILIVMRKQNYIFGVYFIIFLETVFMSNNLVKNFQITGATLAYIISVLSMAVLLLGLVENTILKVRNIDEKNNIHK